LAIGSAACGLATEAWHIAILPFIASLGMGGEWSLGVALVNEVWPERSRSWIAGLIGAASNVGIMLVPIVSMLLGTLIASVRSGLLAFLRADVVESLLANQAWRFLMIVGALPPPSSSSSAHSCLSRTSGTPSRRAAARVTGRRATFWQRSVGLSVRRL
jgi:SHS family sialic acid transporter-like MFS transporter